MNKELFDKVVLEITTAIIDKDYKIPETVVDYDDIANKLGKFHRATLCNNGILCTDIIKAINPEYTPCKDRQTYGFQHYLDHAKDLDLSLEKVDPNILDSKLTRKHLLHVSCNRCGFTETITSASLIRRKHGCKKCIGSSHWRYRIEEYIDIALSKGVYIDSEDIESTIHSKEVPLECMSCGSKFVRGFNAIVYDKYPLNCPHCCPDPIFGKMGLKTLYNNIEFDSNFELESYKLLHPVLPNLEVHVPYSTFSNVPDCKFIADFKSDLLILEVSTFNFNNHPSYAAKIASKKEIVEASGHIFEYAATLAEVRTIIKKYCN